MTDRPHVQLFTDGACLGNPGPGGWAYMLRLPGHEEPLEASGGEDRTTNNRMELIAVIEGLSALAEPMAVELCSDSVYVLKGLSEWLAGWKKRGWRTSAKKPVLNLDLWQRLDELAQTHDLHFTWVRGHTGHAENERCDELATAEALRRKDV